MPLQDDAVVLFKGNIGLIPADLHAVILKASKPQQQAQFSTYCFTSSSGSVNAIRQRTLQKAFRWRILMNISPCAGMRRSAGVMKVQHGRVCHHSANAF